MTLEKHVIVIDDDDDDNRENKDTGDARVQNTMNDLHGVMMRTHNRDGSLGSSGHALSMTDRQDRNPQQDMVAPPATNVAQDLRDAQHRIQHLESLLRQERQKWYRLVACLSDMGIIIHPDAMRIIRQRASCMITHCDRKVSHFCTSCFNTICPACLEQVMRPRSIPQDGIRIDGIALPIVLPHHPLPSQCPICKTRPFCVQRIGPLPSS